jgi:DNA-binding transcriptional LysR family regulator
MLRRFGESHPGVSVNVVVESSTELLARIDRKELDLTLVTCGSGFAATERAEILMSEKLVWASLKGGCAVMRDPLPISVWETGCLWRKAAIDGLEAAGRPYRISFQSAYISAQKAAILADLAVAPMPTSALSGDIVATPSKHGLPPLMDYSLGMVVADNASAPVRAAADHLRASFAQCCEERGLAA